MADSSVPFKKKYLTVLGLSCDMWDLGPRDGTRAPCMHSLNH